MNVTRDIDNSNSDNSNVSENVTRSDENRSNDENNNDKIRSEMTEMITIAINTSDQTVKRDDSVIQSEMITVYGDVELTQQERKFLALGPNFPLMERMENKAIERDFLITL